MASTAGFASLGDVAVTYKTREATRLELKGIRWWDGGAYRNAAFSDIGVARVRVISILEETEVHVHDALDEGEDGQHQASDYMWETEVKVWGRRNTNGASCHHLLNKIADGL